MKSSHEILNRTSAGLTCGGAHSCGKSRPIAQPWTILSMSGRETSASSNIRETRVKYIDGTRSRQCRYICTTTSRSWVRKDCRNARERSISSGDSLKAWRRNLYGSRGMKGSSRECVRPRGRNLRNGELRVGE